MGLTGYYRSFIPNSTAVTVPLIDLTRKNQPTQEGWDIPQEKTFQELKIRLMDKPILRLSDMEIPFILRPDASKDAVEAVLLQEHEDGIFPVGYACRKVVTKRTKVFSHGNGMFCDSMVSLQVPDLLVWKTIHSANGSTATIVHEPKEICQ